MDKQKASRIKKKMIDTVKNQTTLMLCEMFEQTESSKEPSIYTIREMIMDELELRNAEMFDRWMDSDEVSPSSFFLDSLS